MANIAGISEDLNLPRFNPTTDEDGAEPWVRQMDIIRNSFKWDSIQTVLVASKCLQEDAESWFEENRSKLTDWESFKVGILVNFPKLRNFPERIKKALEYKSGNFRLEEYARMKIMLLEKTSIAFSEDNLMDLVIDTIQDEVIKKILLNSNLTRQELFVQLANFDSNSKKNGKTVPTGTVEPLNHW